MPLRITLKSYERFLINGALIRNGSRNADFILESQCKFLRESEIVSESEADTPCKELLHIAQLIYVSDYPEPIIEKFLDKALAIIAVAPSTKTTIFAMQQEIEKQEYYKAIKLGRELVAYEHSLIKNISINTESDRLDTPLDRLEAKNSI